MRHSFEEPMPLLLDDRFHAKRGPAKRHSRPARGKATALAGGALLAAVVSGGLVLGDEGPFAQLLRHINGGTAAQFASALPVLDAEQRLTLYLVRSTLMALDDANRTGRYDVLHAIASPGFQEANPTARLAEIFRAQRQSGLDLSIAALAQPTWTRRPHVDSHGHLELSGHFTRPADRVDFHCDLYRSKAPGGSMPSKWRPSRCRLKRWRSGQGNR
ncbi:MAG: hypothetical protein R3D67_20230 [Hyphomicrobiaceae bacterium]